MCLGIVMQIDKGSVKELGRDKKRKKAVIIQNKILNRFQKHFPQISGQEKLQKKAVKYGLEWEVPDKALEDIEKGLEILRKAIEIGRKIPSYIRGIW